MKTLTVVLAVALIVVGSGSAAAQPATDTYMLVPGIPGESQRDRYEDWIEVFSVAQGFSGAKINACSVSITKRLDKAGPPLWAAAVTGQTFSEIRLEILRLGEEQTKVYELILASARVESITSNPSELMESLTIRGTSATLRYYPQLSTGGVVAPVTATISCK